MKKLLFSAILVLASAIAGAQRPGITCLISDPDPGATNIRNAPKGDIVHQVYQDDYFCVLVSAQKNGWWYINNGELFTDWGETEFVGSPQAWIHYSVLALYTNNYHGELLKLRTEPKDDAPVVATIADPFIMVRPQDTTADFKWIKVRYGDKSGWLEEKWLSTATPEQGDGDGEMGELFSVTIPSPENNIMSYDAPGGNIVRMLPKDKQWAILAFESKNGWWHLFDGAFSVGEDAVVEFPFEEEFWINSKDLQNFIIDEESGMILTVCPLEMSEDHSQVKVCLSSNPAKTWWVDLEDLTY